MDEPRSRTREERQYRHPNFRHGGQLFLVRCFACSERGTENLMRLVPDGVCATCGWKDGDAVPEWSDPESDPNCSCPEPSRG